MITCMKKDYLISRLWMYPLILVILCLGYLYGLPATFLFIVIAATFIITPFVYDEINKSSLFFSSLPIKKRDLVFGRYLYALSMYILLLLLLWGMMGMVAQFNENLYVFHWKDVIVLIALISLFIALSYPTLYLLRPQFAALFIFVYLFGGVILLSEQLFNAQITYGHKNSDIIFSAEFPGLQGMDAQLGPVFENFIPFAPFLIFGVGSVLVLCGSVMLSVFIFERKNM